MTEAITRILVPLDFSPPSNRALQYATTLAARLGASVTLLHVVDNPLASGAWTSEIYVPDLPQMLEALVGEANKRLASLESVAANAGVKAETTVVTGHPAYAIVEHAGAGRFDLIVMGTHGRTGLAHAFVGSVAERVVRRSPCPVLTVRDAAAAKEERPGSAKAVA
jgi:universal stress protein A